MPRSVFEDLGRELLLVGAFEILGLSSGIYGDHVEAPDMEALNYFFRHSIIQTARNLKETNR